MAIVGIDLGTTNSVVATMEHGQVQVLSNAEGKQTTPSVVYFQGAGLDDTVVGEPAVFSLGANPERAVRFIKREMGTDFKINIDGQTYTPEEISSLILKKLKNDAQTEHFGEEEVTDAVVTVPAYFGPQEREATRKAAVKAGLNVLALLPEPIAAAIDFAQNQAEKLADKTVLVYDLGGGTFDVTAMRVERQGGEDGPLAFRILGKDGSVQLGGGDWDQKLAEYVCKEFAAANDDSDPQSDLSGYLRLLMECQRAKEALSIKNPEDTVQIPCTHEGVTYPVEISRQQFEELTQPLLDQTIDKASQLVEKLFGQDEPWSNVDIILLAGGSTKMKCVHETLERLSGMKPQTNRGVDLNVGRGAAYLAFSEGTWQIGEEQAEKRAELRGTVGEHGPRERIVTISDVVNYSIGINAVDAETRMEINDIIIKQGTPNDQMVENLYGLEADGQIAVDIVINRGESNNLAEVEKLGTVEVTGLPPTTRRGDPVRVALKVDANGLIVGEAVHIPSGTRADIRVELEPRSRDVA